MLNGPLRGVRVVELGSIGPGPFACMLLADLGADVLRLERGKWDADTTPTNDLLKRSRPSVAVDFKNSAGRELILELCERADVLVEGFRPGVTERLGLGPDDVWARNERLVYGRMTGYGQTGPLSARAGHDINYISISGALWSIGHSGEKPVPPLNLVGDFGGGSLFLTLGILSALLWARATGQGQVVDASMVDGSASMMTLFHGFLNEGIWREERGMNLLDSGAPFYDVYETSDGRYMAVGALEEQFYEELIRGLGMKQTELPPQMDRATWPMMKALFAEAFASKSRDDWTEIFEGRDACVTPVLSPREASQHPYNTGRDVFTSEGAIQPQPAPRFSLTPGGIASPPGRAGSGTREGLKRWGVSDAEFEEMREAGAFGQ